MSAWFKASFKGQCAAALGAAVLHSAGAASADYNCGSNGLHMPVDGDTNVPLNTRIWNWGHFDEASRARLIGPLGEVELDERFVPVAAARDRAMAYPVLTPRTLLRPNTNYRVEWDYLDTNGYSEGFYFRTGSAPATEPPPLPAVLSVEPSVARSVEVTFDSHTFDSFTFLAGETDARLPSPRSIDDLFLPAGTEYGDFAIDAASPVVRWLAWKSPLVVGFSSCAIWPDREASHEARFAAFDLAGNFSGWGESVPLELPEAPPSVPPTVDTEDNTRDHPPGWGCEVTRSARSTLTPASMCALLLLARARRRRRHRRNTAASG